MAAADSLQCLSAIADVYTLQTIRPYESDIMLRLLSFCYRFSKTQEPHTKGMAMIQLMPTYAGIKVEDATAELDSIRKELNRTVGTLAGNELKIGRRLNEVAASGIANVVYGVDSLDDDGRATAVSKFVATMPKLDSKRASDYMAIARKTDGLIAADVDVSGFVPSTFKSAPVDVDIAEFVAVVEELVESKDGGKFTAAEFTAAGRAAGIVPPAKAGGGGDQLLKAGNELLKAIVKADGKVTATQRRSLENVIAAATELIG